MFCFAVALNDSKRQTVELVRIAIMFGRLHMQPDVFMLTTDICANAGDHEAVNRIPTFADLALVLGGVAQMDRDGMMLNFDAFPSPTPCKTFKAKPC